LQTLQDHQLYVKFNKCDFYQCKIQYIGHVISKEGIAVDLKKDKIYTRMASPKGRGKHKIIYGVNWILSQICRRVLKDNAPYNLFAK